MRKLNRVNTIDDTNFYQGSGNVFVDLGLRNAGELHTKARLAMTLNDILSKLRLSQAAAAKRLGIGQPKISALMNYKLEGFSVERLMKFLTALNCDVEIIIKKKPRSPRRGKITVSAA